MDKETFANLRRPIAVVVDDEPFILMNTSDIISNVGYAIVEATTAEHAYDFLQEHSSVQLLFTDVQTPGTTDGFELARNVARRWPDICVVVASIAAVPAPGDLPENAKFISEPFSAETVLGVLQERCPHRPRRQV
nr:response regulator [Rhizobium sp. S152]